MRVTSTDAGICVDGPSNGRGAWLCRDATGDQIAVVSCLDAALSRRAFARAWRRDITADDEAAISKLAGRGAGTDQHPDAH